MVEAASSVSFEHIEENYQIARKAMYTLLRRGGETNDDDVGDVGEDTA
jgi:hypothetical protein